MAIYNVNKNTGAITETAGRYGATSAEEVSYDNTDSGLSATDVQGAVDELAESYPAQQVMMSDGVTSVEDALDGLTKDSSDTLSNTTYLYTDATIIKKGNVGMIQWNGFKGLTNQSINTISGLIPKKYRPLANSVFDVVAPSTSSSQFYRIKIFTNGNVTVYPYNGASSQNNLMTTITYLI